MKTFERRQDILALLRERQAVKVTDLAEIFNVSHGTIRSDLNYLSETGQVTRIRGGATAHDQHQIHDPAFAARARMNISAKQNIARWAADMVKDGEAIYLDSGTTTFHMIPFLQDVGNGTVITDSLEATLALAKHPNLTVILIGGVVRPGTVSVTGQLSEKALDDLHIRTAFLSCAGFSVKAGMTEADIQTAQLKRKVVRSAENVIALIESSKFGNVQLSSFAGIEQISQILTDHNLNTRYINELRQTRVVLTVCGESTTSSYTPVNQEKAHYKLGFANLGEERPFAVDVRRGLERAAQEAGHIDLVVVDNHYDTRVALEVADQLIQAGVDLAIEYQYDEKTGSLIIDKFNQAGIPVIAVDIPMVGATFFGVDNYRSGRKGGIALGRWIQQHWDGQVDRVLVLEHSIAGPLPAARINGQLDGLQEVLGSLPAEVIRTLGEVDAFDDTEAYVTQALESLPDVHRLAIVSFSDSTAAGAVSAARRLNREEDVVCVCQGAGTRRIRSEIRRPNSRVIAGVAFRPEKYGEQLIVLARQILTGERTPPAVYVDLVLIDANNIDQFYPNEY